MKRGCFASSNSQLVLSSGTSKSQPVTRRTKVLCTTPRCRCTSRHGYQLPRQNSCRTITPAKCQVKLQKKAQKSVNGIELKDTSFQITYSFSSYPGLQVGQALFSSLRNRKTTFETPTNKSCRADECKDETTSDLIFWFKDSSSKSNKLVPQSSFTDNQRKAVLVIQRAWKIYKAKARILRWDLLLSMI